MSFDMNPIRNFSNVQASAKSSDGGAGNTGYFMRGEEDETFNFKRDEVGDSFTKEGANEEENFNFLDSFLNFFSNIFDAIKKFFINLFKKK